jgi:predicted NBD/HSP70 family sugar kinase/biotin operon repressor
LGIVPQKGRFQVGRDGIGNPTSRDYNKASVLEVVLSRAPLTRNEVIELTGLSKATVSRAVEELRADGFVVDGGVDEVTGRGRKSTYLDVPGTTGHVCGISFGVRTTCVLVADLRGREVHHVIVPTVEHRDVTSAAHWLVDLMSSTSEAAAGPLRQVVAAVPGRVRNGTEVFGPAASVTVFGGSVLHRALEDLVDAPVRLDSDANAFLLGLLADDAAPRNAALLSLSSTLDFASCTDLELARGRTPAFGDIGVLFSGVGEETLDGLLSTSGLWLEPHDKESRAAVLEAFTTAVVAAICAVTVTLDPETVYLVGRLQPLVEEVLLEIRARLDERLTAVPKVTMATQVLGLSVARGAVHACLGMARGRLRDAVLDVRRQVRQAELYAPGF